MSGYPCFVQIYSSCLVRTQGGQGLSLAYSQICRHFAVTGSIMGSQNCLGWRAGCDLVQHMPPIPPQSQSKAVLNQIAHDLVPWVFSISKSVPVFDHPHSTKGCPNAYLEFPCLSPCLSSCLLPLAYRCALPGILLSLSPLHPLML